MVTPRHAPGCSVAGNGLLTSLQCRLFRLNATLETCSLQSPTLQMAMVRSTRQQAGTAPKMVEPVTASLPAGAVPETWTRFGPDGSLLSTVMAAKNMPVGVGWKRIGRAMDAPAAMISG